VSSRSDRITLTLPAEREFYGVAHLVLGGLAVRLNLTFEHLEDLQLALDGLLGTPPSGGDEITLTVRVEDGMIETEVGPLAADPLRRELGRDPSNGIGLRRVLETVVDSFELEDRDGAWVRLTKVVGTEAGSEV
jgi:hypothetical protein